MENFRKFTAVLLLVLMHFVASAQSDHATASLKEAKKAIAASNATYFISIAKNKTLIVSISIAEV